MLRLGGVGHPYLEEARLGLAKVVLLICIIPQLLSIPPGALFTGTVSQEGVGAWGKRSHGLQWGWSPGHASLGRCVQLQAEAQPGLQSGPAHSSSSGQTPIDFIDVSTIP